MLDDAGSTSPIVSLIYANNYLYAGLKSGILWRCSPMAANSCTTFDNAGKDAQILSLAYGTLYAGLSTGIVWYCDPNTANQCQSLSGISQGAGVTSLAYGDGQLYAAVNIGGTISATLYQCDDPTVVPSCALLLNVGQENNMSISYANSSIFQGTTGGGQ